MSDVYQNTYKEALRMHQNGVEPKQIFHYLASTAETVAGTGSAVSILLLDEKGLLRNCSSPQLPDDYLKAIDGLAPNPNVGTCAAAAATGDIVITPSFYADNKWAELRHLPMALGYVGAWSVPIKNNNKVLGTFGTYFRQHREPTAIEMSGTQLLASAVARILSDQKAN